MHLISYIHCMAISTAMSIEFLGRRKLRRDAFIVGLVGKAMLAIADTFGVTSFVAMSARISGDNIDRPVVRSVIGSDGLLSGVVDVADVDNRSAM